MVACLHVISRSFGGGESSFEEETRGLQQHDEELADEEFYVSKPKSMVQHPPQQQTNSMMYSGEVWREE